MFVLGIDPGVSRCGYGAVDGDGRVVRARAIGVITTPPSAPLPERLAELAAELGDVLDELGPEVVAIERVFFQVNVRTAMSVGQASGIAMVEAVRRGCEVVEYGPNEVKQAVAGHGAATKAEVQRMVQMLLGLREAPSPPDAADAAALALCHLSRYATDAVVASSGGRGSSR